ncbi:hypothetical protein [Paracraurococcus lichenis]|uniref:Uncharacterized protein n=1 Tax=Paracraurococcus lichenis TaxID=3064888 RepID=A0ABT9EBB0_9PROT|nr:hypothetical protein [Paracraurococcus sp. LOR1-02]MDO9713315.1 hypothetical protein [Paracraurococcus sp. LOR1-02]
MRQALRLSAGVVASRTLALLRSVGMLTWWNSGGAVNVVQAAQ